MPALAAALGLSYLLGSLPSGLWLVRWRARIDVRTVGSGNIGATNAARAAGRGVGLAVLLLDLGKGLVAVRVIAPWLLRDAGLVGALACGLAAVLGHIFTVWLRFRGGKGVATMLGVLLGAMPGLGALTLGIWLATLLASRYVSVSSMVAAASVPVLQSLLGHPPGAVALGGALALVVVARHRGNLERLRQGTEQRVRLRRGDVSGAARR